MKRFVSPLLPVLVLVLLLAAGPGSPGFPSSSPGQKETGRKLVFLRAKTFDPVQDRIQIPENLRFGEDETFQQQGGLGKYYLFQLRGRISAADMAAVKALGGKPAGSIPEGCLVVRLSPAKLKEAGAALRPRWAGRLEPYFRIEPGLLDSSPSAIVVTLFPGEDAASFKDALAEPARELGKGTPRLGASLLLKRQGGFDAETFASLARREEVCFIETYREPEPANDNTIWVGQSHDVAARTNYAISAVIWNHGIIGTGQIAGILDTGLDSDSCFFKYDAAGTTTPQYLDPPFVGTVDPAAKVIAYYAYPNSDPYGGSSHGTATSGVILGDDFTTLSTPASAGHDSGDGMAPQGKLVMQAPLPGMADNLYDAFMQSYGSGARVHSNSWINGVNAYSYSCRQADFYTWDHQDFLPVFGGGNSGGAPNNGSVADPSVAKNVISVAGCTPGTQNDAEDLLDFSRGPAFDGRIKPDIVAPGSSINTAGSDSLPGTNNCNRAPAFWGSSASTPAIAGFILLIRQYYADGFYPSGAANPADGFPPSGALMKATLLNGAVPLAGNDPATGTSVDPIPSFNQGWGRVLLNSVLFFAGDPKRTRVWDKWNQAGLKTGETDAYTLSVGAGAPLKVTLVWTDPPASLLASRALVHDLNLEVGTPSGETYLGNNFTNGESVLGGAPDSLNNVEAVLIRNPAPGTYTVRVAGADIPPVSDAKLGDRQGYALVAVFAPCTSSLPPPSSLTIEDRGAAGIALTWDPVPAATGYTVYRADGRCGNLRSGFYVVGASPQPSLLDSAVVGGFDYSYRVRASDGCGESSCSTCMSIRSTAPCRIPPDFDGLSLASVDGKTCGVRLSWGSGVSSCPGGHDISYNIYRSLSHGFSPSPATLFAAGVPDQEFIDGTAASGVTFYYIARAEDSTAGGGGPANDGNEDGNRVVLNATPYGQPGARGAWLDNGGDTAAKFFLSPEWSVNPGQNHTPAGTLCYQSAKQGQSYLPEACAALTSPALSLDPAGIPVLSYWTRYNLEYQWDGVVVEFLEDGGTGWSDLPPGAGYPGDFAMSDDGSGNPINACRYLQQHGAFSGPSGNAGLTGWTLYTTALTGYAGKTLQIRFRLSTDAGSEFDGFFLDDIQITDVLLPLPCEPCTTPASIENTLKAVKESRTDVRLFWTDVSAATGYRAVGSLKAGVTTSDFTADAPDGLTGALHGGAVNLAQPYFYKVRAKGNCGNLGP